MLKQLCLPEIEKRLVIGRQLFLYIVGFNLLIKINNPSRSFRKMRSQGKLLPPKLERKGKIQIITTYQSRNRGSEALGDECQRRTTSAVTDKLLEAQRGKAWELKAPEGPNHRRMPMSSLWVLTSSSWTVNSAGSYSEYWRKISSCFIKGRRNVTIWNNPEQPAFLNKTCPRRDCFIRA